MCGKQLYFAYRKIANHISTIDVLLNHHFTQVSVLEVVLLGGDGASVLRHTDGFLLVMICGLFVVIAGARATKVPDRLYENFADLSPEIHKKIDSLPDLLAYSLLILVFSNICSNVPTVMLLSHTLRQDGKPTADGIVAWLMLSWTSTVAGNLTLIGSIANLIVAEKASACNHELTFWCAMQSVLLTTLVACLTRTYSRLQRVLEDPLTMRRIHFRFGFWTTLLIMLAGDLVELKCEEAAGVSSVAACHTSSAGWVSDITGVRYRRQTE